MAKTREQPGYRKRKEEPPRLALAFLAWQEGRKPPPSLLALVINVL
jgi:hypothetical protein